MKSTKICVGAVFFGGFKEKEKDSVVTQGRPRSQLFGLWCLLLKSDTYLYSHCHQPTGSPDYHGGHHFPLKLKSSKCF